MTDHAGAGIRHLHALAREPRPAGSAAEARARQYAAGVLRESGFVIEEQPFEYSAFVGTYGLAAVAGLGTLTMLATLLLSLFTTTSPAVPCGVGILMTGLAASYLRPPRPFTGGLMRRPTCNVVARRPGIPPTVWLVAHLDTKSQPIPSMARALCSTAFVALIVVLLASITAFDETLFSAHRTLTWALVVLVLIAGVPLTLCITGFDSDGAVDNASGVAAVLSAAGMIGTDKAVGVLLTSAEELGMAGAEAWVHANAPGTALNCDGVDDVGQLTIMHNGAPSERVLGALRRTSHHARIIRMPFGVLTDSTVFQRMKWDAVTVSHGSLATLSRIHRPADSLANLRGTSIDATARVLARAAEELSS